MPWQNATMYNIDPHIAELYDQSETYQDDVALIRRLIAGRGPLRILEPFCGTGRILIPLAQDGHELTGLDAAQGMLNRAQTKIDTLSPEVSARITLTTADIVHDAWPQGFDLVILGGNCFYELATPQEQAGCIAAAAAALKPGGFVYVDNNHMEGPLAASWQQRGSRPGFPTGICRDGTRVESTTETIWFDINKRLARFRRSTCVTRPDGRQFEQTYEQQKHPVSRDEVLGWLRQFGFTIEALYGDRAGNPYVASSERAIFWARKGSS
ncbi:MAG: class I SAM-dependent methyltransferase [Anaerolineales bacterium]|nr:class I SAM-dependent methyltransferase [Anaerolineales bacterium]